MLSGVGRAPEDGIVSDGPGDLHPNEVAVFSRLPLQPEVGLGCHLWDAHGNRYLDMYGGHAVALTGHCHPRVVAAIREQAERLLFYSNAVPLAIREAAFTALAALAPADVNRVFLVNTGAEANEQALILARRVTGRSQVVTVEGGFHGRSLATLAVAGIERYRRLAERSGGEALVAETLVCPFDDVGALGRIVDHTTAAVIVEPIQGLAGARELSVGFLEAARGVCDAVGALLVFDEVQCGCGRSGAFTAAQAYSVFPDIITLAKGIAAGLPMGALLMTAAVAASVRPGELGNTFGGGPLVCAAAVANLAVLADEDLAGNALRMESYLRSRLARQPGIRRITGKGLLLGLVLDRPARPVQQALLARGVLVGGAEAADAVRLLPPLVLGADDADEFMAILDEVLR